MFKNKKEVPGSNPSLLKNQAPTLLSADLVINGNLESDGDIQVDGTVEGDIRSKKLTISTSAVVRGSIDAENILIAGTVTGQIKARHVTLTKSAKVIADVIQERLTIEPGAFFEGNCRQFPGEEEATLRRIEQKSMTKPNGAGTAASTKNGVAISDAA
jgi:cytoskeletal protein CcmA (bactofilin family)